MAADEETQAFEQMATLKISDSGPKKENINVVSIGHVGMITGFLTPLLTL